MRKVYAALVVLLFVLSGCAGPGATVSAEATDFISNTEVRNNKAMFVWQLNDITSAYCTFDKAIYRKAQQYRQQRIAVTIHYQSINKGDSDGAFLGQGCDPERTGVQTFRLVSLEPASEEQVP